MSAARKKDSKVPEDVPGAGDPDRKRVLNVLAQRRYRQRRREKLAALEARAGNQSSPQSPTSAQATCSDSSSIDPSMLVGVDPTSGSFVFPAVDFGENALDEQLLESLNNSGNSSNPSNSPALAGYNSPSTTTPSLTFSIDGAQLSVPVISAMRGALNIIAAMGLSDLIWDPNYLHTFPSSVPLHNLPPNLHPTTAQLTLPHHPILDAMPWPAIREKLICMLALPSAYRPPVARDHEPDSMGQGEAIRRLTEHLDHFTDGLRIHSNMVGWGETSELVEEAWEIGECFFRNWWWCMDEETIRTTNKKRKERGLGPLRIRG